MGRPHRKVHAGHGTTRVAKHRRKSWRGSLAKIGAGHDRALATKPRHRCCHPPYYTCSLCLGPLSKTTTTNLGLIARHARQQQHTTSVQDNNTTRDKEPRQRRKSETKYKHAITTSTPHQTSGHAMQEEHVIQTHDETKTQDTRARQAHKTTTWKAITASRVDAQDKKQENQRRPSEQASTYTKHGNEPWNGLLGVAYTCNEQLASFFPDSES